MITSPEGIAAWQEDEAAYAQYERTGQAIPIAAMEEWVRSWGSESELPPPRATLTPSP